MAEALLALGGNVGDSRTTLSKAIALLCDDRDIALKARSSDYRTPPWGDTEQAPFINVCIAVETALDPHQLLASAHAVERLLGRNRASERRWGPRTCDIDLLAYEDLALDENGLVLPHPRVFERAFVLIPLAEIAGGRRIAGQLIGEVAAAIDAAGIERLPAA